MMTRFLVAMTFLSEHAKPLILWAGGAVILVADAVTEIASGAISSAEKVGSLPVTAVLALMLFVFGLVIWKQEKNAKEERDKREVRDIERDKMLLAVIDRNSDVMDEMKRETAKQTSHFEGIGRTLIEKGLNASQIPHARRDPPTKRSNA